MSDDLIHDVEEALKQERLEQFWKEYGSYIIAAAVLAVLFTATISGWRSYNARANMADTEAVMMALEADNQPQAVSAMLDSENLRGGQEAVARLTAAGLLMREEKAEDALLHYRAVASDTAVPPMLRELGTYLAARTAWTMAEENSDAEALISELMPVINNNNSSWRYHARVLAAMIYASDLEDYQAAREVLAPVQKEQNLPFSLIQTARALDQVYQERLGRVESAPEQQNNVVEEPEG